MKAVIIEIHKNHCIAVTFDGRFVKQSIGQGELEIGDEIMVETGYLARRMDWTKTLAIAAAAALVIGLGSWGMFRISGWHRPASNADVAAESGIMKGEEEKIAGDEVMTVAVEQTSEEESGMTDVSEDSAGFTTEIERAEGIATGPGEIDATIALKIANIGQPAEIIAGNLLFLYWAKEAEKNMELLFGAELLDPELSFTGKIKASVFFDDGTIAGEDTFSMKKFGGEDKIQEFIVFESGAYDLNIMINGIFE